MVADEPYIAELKRLILETSYVSEKLFSYRYQHWHESQQNMHQDQTAILLLLLYSSDILW